MIHDRVGDRLVLTLGLPGCGRPGVAPRRTNTGGRPSGWSAPPSLRRFRPRCVWIAGRRSGSFSELIVRQPPALYIPHECGFSALSAGPDVRILSLAAELRSKLLSTVIGGDPAPTAFLPCGSRSIRTREPPRSSMPRFADLLDYAGEGMVGGFSLGSMICGLHRARSQPCPVFLPASERDGITTSTGNRLPDLTPSF